MAAAVFLGPAASFMFILFGTRIWLAITGRTAGRRLRTIIGLESEEYGPSRGDLVFDMAFVSLSLSLSLSELLVLIVLVDNLNRPDGGFAARVAALEIVFAGLWIVGLYLVTGRATKGS